MRRISRRTALQTLSATALAAGLPALAQEKKKKEAAPKKSKAPPPPTVAYPPVLPGGKTVVTDTSELFLKGPDSLREGVTIAKAVPTIDFGYYPGQDYEGKPWSNWGDSTSAPGKYYSAIGDHLWPQGNALVYEYDANAKTFRTILDLKKLLNMPEGHYSPGKFHSRVDLGSDGWLYCSTHRGSPAATNDKYFYKGDWIVRANPATGEQEIVTHAPVPKHCIPNGTLDPDRMIFYGGTAPGEGDSKDIRFFAYDCKNRKLLYTGPGGPARYMILARSTGRVYYIPGTGTSPLMRFDPAVGKPEEIPGEIGIRAATRETPQGFVYTCSLGQGAGAEATLYAFNTKTEKAEPLGLAQVGGNAYVASMSVDPTGRYVYYVPGAHGGSERDNSAVVQFDTKTRTRKVIAFLHPFYEQKYGLVCKGTYAVSCDPAGDKLYVTWNVSRGTKAWDSCGVTTIHIPESERPA